MWSWASCHSPILHPVSLQTAGCLFIPIYGRLSGSLGFRAFAVAAASFWNMHMMAVGRTCSYFYSCPCINIASPEFLLPTLSEVVQPSPSVFLNSQLFYFQHSIYFHLGV